MPGQALPKGAVTLRFVDKDGRVYCEFTLAANVYAAVKRAARKNRCGVLTFIKRAIEAKITALEIAQSGRPHSVRKGGVR